MISTALTIALAMSPSVGAAGGEQCGLCHPVERVAFEQSVHSRESIGCTECHGGDPRSVDVDRAHKGRFRSLGDRRQIPKECARCHSDLNRMRPYNLPTDQYAIYQTSQHGRALAGGDGRVATCSDCHGAHDVLPGSDPQSRVHHRNIPATCAICHADESLMKQYGIDPTIEAQYRSSVHGKALLEEGNTAAPECSRCHGVHGATPPGVGDVEKVCGSCHQQVRRAFRSGPHYAGMREAGLSECASCHGYHAIRWLKTENLEDLCAQCHAEESEEARLGRALRSTVEAAESEIDKAEELIREAEQVPLDMEDHRARIIQARTYLTELPTITHELLRESVETLALRARSVGEEVQHDVYWKLSQRSTRRIGLAALWFYVVMTVAILIGYKRRLRRGETAE